LDEINHYLVNPPVLVPPQKYKPFKLYLSADERAIGPYSRIRGKRKGYIFCEQKVAGC